MLLVVFLLASTWIAVCTEEGPSDPKPAEVSENVASPPGSSLFTKRTFKRISSVVRRLLSSLRSHTKQQIQDAQKAADKADKKDFNPYKIIQNVILGGTIESYRAGLHFRLIKAILKFVKRRFHLKRRDIKKLLKLREIKDLLKEGQRKALALGEVPGVSEDVVICPWPKSIVCDKNAKYRTINGECNNLVNSETALWGRAFTPLARLVPSDYADGFDSPRVASDGSALPSARKVAFDFHEHRDDTTRGLTSLVMTYGQFLDHDIDKTAIIKELDENHVLVDAACPPDNCGQGGVDPESHPDCFPISIPTDDPDYQGEKCLKFVRSQAVPPFDCTVGPRQQINQITSYLDLNVAYGSSEEELRKLRDYRDPSRGKLLLRPHPYACELKPLLPEKRDEVCFGTDELVSCVRAGDGRVNEHMGLMVLHTLFVREHNRIEAELARLNPHWDGQRLFEESRRISIAEWVVTVYNEYLPVTLGPDLMRKHNLELLKDGYYKGYNSSENAQASNVFATAAFRFGHSQVGDFLRLTEEGYKEFEDIPFSKVFMRPHLMYPTYNVDRTLRGFVHLPLHHVDRAFSRQVSVHMFTKAPPFGVGTSLPTLNIHRGRDHGIPGYNAFRKFCGLKEFRSFDELISVIPCRSIIEKLEKLYKTVDDIDIFPAGLAERVLPGSTIGETFGCLIGEQFRRLRDGDRFWFENRFDPNIHFTLEQINELRKARLSKIMCDNADDLKTIQPFAMVLPLDEDKGPYTEQDDFGLLRKRYGPNKRVSCGCLPGVDLSKWKEHPTGQSGYT